MRVLFDLSIFSLLSTYTKLSQIVLLDRHTIIYLVVPILLSAERLIPNSHTSSKCSWESSDFKIAINAKFYHSEKISLLRSRSLWDITKERTKKMYF